VQTLYLDRQPNGQPIIGTANQPLLATGYAVARVATFGNKKMKTKLETATAKFREGYNCAQSVLYAHCDDLHLDGNTSLRITCGFGAGMGRKEEICGAVSGGILVLGLRHGRGDKDDRAATELTYTKTRDLMERFQQRHGTFICKKLLNGCDLTTAEGQRSFKDNDLFNRVCVRCVESVMAILEDIK